MSEWISNHILETGFGAVTTGMLIVIKKLFRKVKELEAIKHGMQALLRAQIIQTYNTYMDKGYFPIYERENVQGLTEQYFALGGNGVIHGLIEKLEVLPTDPPTNKQEGESNCLKL